jgi:predicted RNA binding protein YcfA (HicA-like mRNA interferase family)
MKVSELLGILEQDGWFLVRQRGSHRQFHHAKKSGTVTVAGKPSLDVPRGTLTIS